MFLGAFIDGEPAGAAMLHDMRQFWLGRPVEMAGVASVKVAPEHRGRGIGRTLMTELLGVIAERGYPLSVLYPATTPIYRSLGWELTGAKHQFRIPSRSLRDFVQPDATARGAGAGHRDVPIRRATAADAATVIKVIGDSHRAARDAGPLTWDEGPAGQWLGRKDLYSYLAGDDGFAAYRWRGDDLWVERVHSRTPETLRALWSVIASHSSTTDHVRGWTSPSDPFWWLTRERDATIISRSMWMLRVVDAAAAVAARGFPPGLSVRAALEIHDQARPANSGHWQLTVADGTGTLTPNGGVPAPAALTLGPRGVAALYAGTPVPALRLAGLASGGTPAQDADLDAAFAATPYMVDDF
jgi:predicted acetyltransferase